MYIYRKRLIIRNWFRELWKLVNSKFEGWVNRLEISRVSVVILVWRVVDCRFRRIDVLVLVWKLCVVDLEMVNVVEEVWR